jgi:hypothetical protein
MIPYKTAERLVISEFITRKTSLLSSIPLPLQPQISFG